MESKPIIVIENSANCNLHCEACPTVHAYNYPKKFMSQETFNQIIQNISPHQFPRCALMGWGEPLLDPLYQERLLLLKKRGYIVGSTSNLTLLTEKRARKLIVNGLDHLGVSVDANHIIGAGYSLTDLQKKMEFLFRLIEKNSAQLRVGINIILFKKNLDIVFEIIERLKFFPLTHIGIAPLIMIPTKELYNQLIAKDELLRLKQDIIGRFPNLPISFQYLEEEIKGNCRSDIFNNVYVDYSGNVCPCCVFALKFPNITFEGQIMDTQIMSFGNLKDSGFEQIWNSRDYKDFRQRFKENKIPEICACCNAWRILPDRDYLKGLQDET